MKTNTKRINVNIASALHARFKAATAAQGMQMTDVLIEFIKEYVAKQRLEKRSSI